MAVETYLPLFLMFIVLLIREVISFLGVLRKDSIIADLQAQLVARNHEEYLRTVEAKKVEEKPSVVNVADEDTRTEVELTDLDPEEFFKGVK